MAARQSTRNRRLYDAHIDTVMAYAIFYPTIEVLSAVAIGLILWFGGVGAINGAITFGALVAFIQYAQRFYRPIMDLSEKYNILQGAMASSERIFNLLDTEPQIKDPAEPRTSRSSRTPSRTGRSRIIRSSTIRRST